MNPKTKWQRATMMLLFLVGIMALNTGCGYVSIQPGEIGVVVHKYGGNKGVDVESVGVGAHWYNPMTTDIYEFSTAMQNYVWTASEAEGRRGDESISFQTKEGLAINGDFGITYEVDPTKVAILYQKYREGIKEITHVFIRNNVRDALNKAASSMSVEEVVGQGKIRLLDAAISSVKSEVGPLGINVEKVYLIGTFRLPESVQKALDGKLTAQQAALQTQNEVAQAVAEGQKKLALARAEADANRLVANSLSPTLVSYYKIQKWDGKLPQVTGGSIPMLDMRTSSAPAPAAAEKE